MQFRNLYIGQTFDWINDAVSYNSFFKRCTKVSNTTYRDEDGVVHSVGTTKAEVFHVGPDLEPEIDPENYISVVVKGNAVDAKVAADRRRIPFAFANYTAHGETVGNVPARYLLPVMAWYGESGEVPYSVGTCLVFSHHKVEHEAGGDAAEAHAVRDIPAAWEEEEAAANVAFRAEVDAILEPGSDAYSGRFTPLKLGSTMRVIPIKREQVAVEMEEDAEFRQAEVIRLLGRIKGALGTAEEGDALVEVASDAHRAEQALATAIGILREVDDARRLADGKLPSPVVAGLIAFLAEHD